MDLSLEGRASLAPRLRIPRFNPCFHGSLSGRLPTLSGSGFCVLVSILVFMDLSLEDGTETRKDGTLVCFNPCFHGSLSGRCLLTVAPNLFYDVSILVFMDLSLEDESTVECIMCIPVSILVFMDLSLEVAWRWHAASEHIKFQS